QPGECGGQVWRRTLCRKNRGRPPLQGEIFHACFGPLTDRALSKAIRFCSACSLPRRLPEAPQWPKSTRSNFFEIIWKHLEIIWKYLIVLMEATTRIELVYTVLQTVA